LVGAVLQALDTHPSVHAARAGESALTAAVGQARAVEYPQVRAQTALTQFQEPMLVAPLHGFDFTQPPKFENTLIRGDVTVGYKLYDGGERRSRVTGAEAQAAAAAAATASVESSLVAEVARGYLEILTARGVLDAQERRIEALAAERRRVELLFAEGRAARVELLRVEASLAEAQAGRVAAAARLELGERELARLIGTAPEGTPAASLRPVTLRDEPQSQGWAVWLDRARAASPELQRAREDVEAVAAERQAASAAWYPNVDLTGTYLLFTSVAGGTTAEWQAGVNVSYPIFTGGSRSSMILTAEARERRAREDLHSAELQIERAVDRALTVARETRAVVEAVAEGAQHQAEVARIEHLSLEAGAGTQTDYLRAEADLARARSALVEAGNAEIAAWVELARVVGILTPEWLESNLENAR